MRKTLFLFITVLLLGSASFAQNGAFSEGDKLLNVGIGVNSYYSGGIPFGASLEFGVTDAISVGGSIDYLSTDYGAMGLGAKFTALYIGARANYHFNELLNIDNDQVDVYGGLTLGYRSFSWKDNYGGDLLGNKFGSGMYLGALIGGKYYFTDNIGAFLELGAIGATNARIGVAFKL